jgi:hypothetical protein
LFSMSMHLQFGLLLLYKDIIILLGFYLFNISLHFELFDADIVDCFFTRQSFELWSGRLPLHLRYFCEYMIDTTASTTSWVKLAVRGSHPVVQRRLAISRAFSRLGIHPIPQPHLHYTIFILHFARAVYDRICSTRYIGRSIRSSYIEVLCDSDTWSVIFGSLCTQRGVTHRPHSIELVLNDYDTLREHFFYSWRDFPDRLLHDATSEHPYPPRTRVDPLMTFTFYGQSRREPHLRVAFTWEEYIWHPVHGEYIGVGLTGQRFIL